MRKVGGNEYKFTDPFLWIGWEYSRENLIIKMHPAELKSPATGFSFFVTTEKGGNAITSASLPENGCQAISAKHLILIDTIRSGDKGDITWFYVPTWKLDEVWRAQLIPGIHSNNAALKFKTLLAKLRQFRRKRGFFILKALQLAPIVIVKKFPSMGAD
uniref:Uncharacterized protein n=1 Tax=Timema bartmani TaxID=61472 RepID=A0A7R9I3Q4_9NEOP|nr:unnamed protein product [Timema bartmani]